MLGQGDKCLGSLTETLDSSSENRENISWKTLALLQGPPLSQVEIIKFLEIESRCRDSIETKKERVNIPIKRAK